MELLSPAGDRASMIAAVQNGADAVYLGTRAFNARRGADNFGGEGLAEAVSYCHARGVRVYVALNTMAREDEFPELARTVAEVYLSGADAFIVQDLGVAVAARRIAPEMELHASTQMAVHNRQGVEFLAKRGFSRVVLAREMEFSEIRECARRGVLLEAFAHGALCVSCSGQCLMSSMIGGRSGNRGMCAQPCRINYRMGGQEGYLLSTRDLMTVEILDGFRDAGVSSLKIEGRMRRPEYVAVATGIYRRALDGGTVGEADVEALRQIFNRGGLTRGYAPGVEERTLMYRERPNNIGVRVGRCDKKGEVALEADIEQADALVLRGSGEDVPVKLAGARGERAPCPEAKKGDQLIRLVSEKQMRAARESYAGESRLTPLTARLTLRVGEPARLSVSDGQHIVEAAGGAVERAQNRPLDRERAEAQIGKTGGTPYVFHGIQVDRDADAFAPLSEINNLRRAALEELTKSRCAVHRTPGALGEPERVGHPQAANGLRAQGGDADAAITDRVKRKNELRAQSGDVDALRIALENGADAVIFAPEDMRRLDEALALPRFFLAVPQVMRAEELDALCAWAAAHAEQIEGAYLSNVAHLDLNWPGERIADYPLNIANNLAAEQAGCDRFTPSVELAARQIDALDGEKEIVVYGYLPLMQLRHCPKRAAEDMPGPHRSCRVCDRAGAEGLPELADRTGARFPLRRIAYDSGCVVQLLNSVPLMLLKKKDRLPEAAVWRILIDRRDAAAAARLYRAALNGRNLDEFPEWERFSAMKSTTGHFFRGV